MTKSELRKLYLEKRRELPAEQAAAGSRRIADTFFENFDLAGIATVHTFIRIAKFNEIDTSMIYYRLWRDHPHIVTAAPRAELATATLESIAFDSGTEWIENSWGIREPASGETVEPADIDLVLVPLLAVDNSGHRVGYGKGMYDRFLAQCRPDCKRVGLSWFEPVTTIDDVGSHDLRLDACVTPHAVYRFDA